MRNLTMLCALLCLAVAPAWAVGPVDGEIGAIWWQNDFESTGGSTNVSDEASAPGFRAELWFAKKFGVRAATFNADVDNINVESSDYTSVDVLYKLFAPTKNNFIALGAGWQEMDLESIGVADGTSGARISAEGRVGLIGMVHVYGQGSYLPELDDAPAMNSADGMFREIEGMEYEVGLSWKMFPFVAAKAGYRVTDVDFTRTDALSIDYSGNAKTDGYFAGISAQF